MLSAYSRYTLVLDLEHCPWYLYVTLYILHTLDKVATVFEHKHERRCSCFWASVKNVCKNAKCGRGDCLVTKTAPFYECKCTAPYKPPACKRRECVPWTSSQRCCTQHCVDGLPFGSYVWDHSFVAFKSCFVFWDLSLTHRCPYCTTENHPCL